jgi:hypothetical protein
MNDYEANFLAADHSRQLLAEADRHRSAAASKRSKDEHKPQARSRRRISFGFLLGRSPA